MLQYGGMRKFKAALVTSALLGLTIALGACASAPATPDEKTMQSPDAGGGVGDFETEAAWLDAGRLIGLVTYGSSSCVPVVEDATVAGDVITVTFAKQESNAVCTADMAPRVSVFGVPEGTDVTEDVNILIAGTDEDADLDGLDAAPADTSTDYAPSAGWYNDKGGFIVATWGSSTCVPVIDAVEPTGTADVALTFATPKEDRPCTLDRVPRANIAQVDGLATQDDITLLLSGDNITGSTLILG